VGLSEDKSIEKTRTRRCNINVLGCQMMSNSTGLRNVRVLVWLSGRKVVCLSTRRHPCMLVDSGGGCCRGARDWLILSLLHFLTILNYKSKINSHFISSHFIRAPLLLTFSLQFHFYPLSESIKGFNLTNHRDTTRNIHQKHIIEHPAANTRVVVWPLTVSIRLGSLLGEL